MDVSPFPCSAHLRADLWKLLPRNNSKIKKIQNISISNSFSPSSQVPPISGRLFGRLSQKLTNQKMAIFTDGVPFFQVPPHPGGSSKRRQKLKIKKKWPFLRVISLSPAARRSPGGSSERLSRKHPQIKNKNTNDISGIPFCLVDPIHGESLRRLFQKSCNNKKDHFFPGVNFFQVPPTHGVSLRRLSRKRQKAKQ